MHQSFWKQTVSPQLTLLATMTSAGLHAFLFTVVLPAGLSPRHREPSEQLLPALYLYAPDRVPQVPREFRIPIAQPLGSYPTDQPEHVAGDDGPARLPSLPAIEGMLPAGVPYMTLDSVFSVLAVDSEVVRYGSSAAPSYPPTLLEAGIEGEVESEFVVDTTGTVDPTSVIILFATDPEFSRSVHEALQDMRFRPAWRGKHKVRQLVHQRFSFQIFQLPQSSAAS